MQSDNVTPGFRIWGADQNLYGPVDLATLVNWVKDARISADTWVYCGGEDLWHKAPAVPQLQALFPGREKPKASFAGPGVSESTALISVQPKSLRRVKVLDGFTDDQLVRFANFMEVIRTKEGNEVVKQGAPGDAMYLLLEGELRVRMMAEGKEIIIVTLGPGEFFGEISLFDHGPRSTDVMAIQDSKLLRIAAPAFAKMISDAPDLAAPFLFAMGKTLVDRIRADNKRYRDSIRFAQATQGAAPPR